MMSDDNTTPEPNDDIDPRPDAEEAEAVSTEPTAEERIAQLEAEKDQLRDQVLRTAAEMDNLRKRTEREVSDTRSYAIAGFARDMLVATDNLSRALMVIPAELRENADGTLKSLIEGIEMTEREMQRLLQKNGVTPIVAEGEKFDPHRHQAMFEVPDASVPEGTVVQVVQTGYAIGERVLRPAMVGVAKGGNKPAPKPDAEPGEGLDTSA
ncbi:MAG TPA: nucleotide exchange factor GrpE [Pelagibacterium sp.]|mgnify:FL=1|uniref:nucleotide exchange factor GrpE n=1 Tax=uncultured Pelagibacterium sp. TaxID=1159875 RepID=UPI000C358FF9|nr:nucleotide exchange factor GrpE [Pelagibacterium sp.]HCO55184.1 nucleotide exchange factor GrpE [Pelagibacterium sp.]|tara:strand:+ start:1606 stop:2235 length:630 start_codon:yes stop_codon:yes gene_type:complete